MFSLEMSRVSRHHKLIRWILDRACQFRWNKSAHQAHYLQVKRNGSFVSDLWRVCSWVYQMETKFSYFPVVQDNVRLHGLTRLSSAFTLVYAGLCLDSSLFRTIGLEPIKIQFGCVFWAAIWKDFSRANSLSTNVYYIQTDLSTAS